MEIIKKKLANLLSVKSLVTLVLTGVFCFHGLYQPDQPGLHDHLCGHHCVLLRHPEPKGAGLDGQPGGEVSYDESK